MYYTKQQLKKCTRGSLNINNGVQFNGSCIIACRAEVFPKYTLLSSPIMTFKPPMPLSLPLLTPSAPPPSTCPASMDEPWQRGLSIEWQICLLYMHCTCIPGTTRRQKSVCGGRERVAPELYEDGVVGKCMDVCVDYVGPGSRFTLLTQCFHSTCPYSILRLSYPGGCQSCQPYLISVSQGRLRWDLCLVG